VRGRARTRGRAGDRRRAAVVDFDVGLRAAIDATAEQWFAAQARANSLDHRIELLTKTLLPTRRNASHGS